jgi:aminocarboxymuconate-semialdehyde decarboxylase
MLAQTADTYHIFTFKGLQNQYKDIRVCFAHGNQFGQMNTGRRKQGFLGRPDLFVGSQNPDEALGQKNIYFDTLLHDLYSFELLLKRQGVSQIVAGLDDPYPLGEMESVPGSYPGKLIDMAAQENIITEQEKTQIWFDNVVEWLCGDDKTEFLNRLGVSN